MLFSNCSLYIYFRIRFSWPGMPRYLFPVYHIWLCYNDFQASDGSLASIYLHWGIWCIIHSNFWMCCSKWLAVQNASGMAFPAHHKGKLGQTESYAKVEQTHCDRSLRLECSQKVWIRKIHDTHLLLSSSIHSPPIWQIFVSSLKNLKQMWYFTQCAFNCFLFWASTFCLRSFDNLFVKNSSSMDIECF